MGSVILQDKEACLELNLQEIPIVKLILRSYDVNKVEFPINSDKGEVRMDIKLFLNQSNDTDI